MQSISTNTIQSQIQELENENRQLKETIVALRDELEKNKAKEELVTQKVVAEANLQAQELKNTISALRQQLELKIKK